MPVAIIVIVILVATVGFAALASTTSANHAHDPHNHIGSINTGAPEDFCVWIRDGSTTQSLAYTRIKATLMEHNPGGDWHGIGTGRVSFNPNGGVPCPDDPERATRDIEFEVGNYGCPQYSDPNVSCALNVSPYFDSASGHTELLYSNIQMKTTHVTGALALYHHAINHELGHTFGLRDGDGTCPGSIMHSAAYGCGPSSNIEWPAAIDINSVVALMPEVGSGGGGGGGGK